MNDTMPIKKSKLREFFGLIHGIHSGRIHPAKVSMLARKAAKKISPSDIKEYAKSKDKKLPLKIMREILGILKDIHEPMYLNEVETNPVSKTFNIEGDYELELKKYMGVPFGQKELEAIDTYTETKPTKIEKNLIRYETTDAFQNTTTTVIKKLKEGSQFVYTAFTKYEQSQPKSENPSQGQGQPSPGAPPMMEQDGINGEEDKKKDTIVITKSTPFKDDIAGGSVLSEFLKKIDL